MSFIINYGYTFIIVHYKTNPYIYIITQEHNPCYLPTLGPCFSMQGIVLCASLGSKGSAFRMWPLVLIPAQASVGLGCSLGYMRTHTHMHTHDLNTKAHVHSGPCSDDYSLLFFLPSGGLGSQQMICARTEIWNQCSDLFEQDKQKVYQTSKQCVCKCGGTFRLNVSVSVNRQALTMNNVEA